MILVVLVIRYVIINLTGTTPPVDQQPAPREVRRLEATAFIPAQTLITPFMLREVPVSQKLAYGEIPPQEWVIDRKDVEGHISRESIAPGTLLERSMVGGEARDEGLAALVPYGRRAQVIHITRDAPSMLHDLVRPGDHVDIIATFKEDKFSKTIVEDVPVLAVDASADRDVGNIAQRGSLATSGPPPKITTGSEGKPVIAAADGTPAKGADGKEIPAPAPAAVAKPTITIGVYPTQAEIVALAGSLADLDFVVRSRYEQVTYSYSSVLPSRRGKTLADISPYLVKAPKSQPKESKGTPAIHIPVHGPTPDLPSAPKRFPLVRVPPAAPSAADGLEKRAVSDKHTIEVRAPGSVRMVEVPKPTD